MSNLAAIIDQVELDLKDTSNATWSTAELTQHIRRALQAYSRVDPIFTDTAIASTADTRAYSLASITQFFQVVDVYYPYNSTTPQYPINQVAWRMIANETLFIDEDDAPSGDGDDKIRVFYSKGHTIEDLDAAAATTLSAEGEVLVILGATAYAAVQYAQSLIGKVTVSGWTPKQLTDWALARLVHFQHELDTLSDLRVAATDARVAMQMDLS